MRLKGKHKYYKTIFNKMIGFIMQNATKVKRHDTINKKLPFHTFQILTQETFKIICLKKPLLIQGHQLRNFLEKQTFIKA